MIIWNGSPGIFSLSNEIIPLEIRWYGLLFASGFLVSQQVLYYIFKKEGKPVKDVDTLTVYMVIAAIIGARFGHVLFYEPNLLIESPISALLPIALDPFRFTGYVGLASHGGALAILFALWLYVRKKRPGQNYLQIVDRIVIVVAITGAFIRVGNFFNSEIVGTPYAGPGSVVFMSPVSNDIYQYDQNSLVSNIQYKMANQEEQTPYPTLDMYIQFNEGVGEAEAQNFIVSDVHFILNQNDGFVDQPYGSPLSPTFVTLDDGTLAAKVQTRGIARHPAQLYEAFSCIVLFGLLFWVWRKQKQNTPPGLIFGLFMVILWPLRFFYEFFKENQVPFEDTMALNMGQLLSIPLALVGIFLIIHAYKKAKPSV